MITFSSSHSRTHNIVIAMRIQIYETINTSDNSINAEDQMDLITLPNIELLFCRYCVIFTKGNISRKTHTIIYIAFKCTANYLSVSLLFFFSLMPIHYICITNIFTLAKIFYTFLRFEISLWKIYSPVEFITENRS